MYLGHPVRADVISKLIEIDKHDIRSSRQEEETWVETNEGKSWTMMMKNGIYERELGTSGGRL